MKLITELTDDVQYITEENKSNGKKDLFIEGIFLQGDIKNRNGRVYPGEVLEKEVNRYVKQYVNENRAMGELNHPSGPTINLDRVSHKIVSLVKEGSNWIGKAKIGSRGMGEVARGLIEDGIQLGVSSRGLGSLKENRQGIMEVQSDFYLATAADIVADPSAPDAFVNGIMESVEWVNDNGVFKEIDLETAKRVIDEAAGSVDKSKLEEAKLSVWENFFGKI